MVDCVGLPCYTLRSKEYFPFLRFTATFLEIFNTGVNGAMFVTLKDFRLIL